MACPFDIICGFSLFEPQSMSRVTLKYAHQLRGRNQDALEISILRFPKYLPILEGPFPQYTGV